MFGIPSKTIIIIAMFWLLALTIMTFQLYKRKRLDKEFLGESN
jgi:hypothetical protein